MLPPFADRLAGRGADPEIEAMRAIAEALIPLDAAARTRVISWAAARFTSPRRKEGTVRNVEIITLICTVLISGPFAMVVSQALKRSGWSERWRFLLALVVGLVVGVAQTWVSGDLGALVSNWGSLTGLQVVTWAGLVWASSQAWYHLWFADTAWMLRLGEWPDREG